MLRESEFFKNKKCWILLCAELLLLAIGIAGLFGEKGIIAGTDKTQMLMQEGISLSPGVYTARIYYETEGNGANVFGVKPDEASVDSIRSNSVTLWDGMGAQECQFYVLDEVDNLKIYIEENGGQPLTVLGVELEAGVQGSCMWIFMVLLGSLAANTVAVIWLYQKKHPLTVRQQAALFAVPGAALLSCIPLLVDYTIVGADLGFHLMRIEALSENIMAFSNASRVEHYWLAGHGYANSFFYADTFLVFPALLRMIGFDLTTSYNFYVAAVNIATAWVSYVAFKKCFDRTETGVFGSVVYTLSPYRLYNIYNRCAVGEYTAMIFLPLLAWGFYKIFTENIEESKYKRNWLIPVIGFSGIIQSHALSCEMVGVFVVLLCIILWKKTFRRQTFLVLAKTVVITALVNAWFIVPFLDMMLADSYYLSNNANALIQKKGVYPAHLFYTLQAAGESSNFISQGMVDTEPIGLGVALLLCMGMWIWLRWKKRKEKEEGDVVFLLVCISLFMSTSLFPADFLSSHSKLLASLIGTLQFPTRLTAIATISMVLLACITAKKLLDGAVSAGAAKSILAGICLFSVIFGMYQMNDVLNTKSILRLYSAQNMGNSVILGAEYLPMDASLEHVIQYHGPNASEGTMIEDYQKEYLNATAYVETTGGDGHYIEFPMLYYKGYHAENADTGEKLQTVKGDNADVRVLLPGNFAGNIRCSYEGMWYWHISDVVSILSCIGILILCFGWKKKEIPITERS